MFDSNKIFFIIVAAGKGLRMGSKIKKQYLSLKNLPVLSHTLLKFSQYTKPHETILVIPLNDFEYCKEKILKPIKLENKIHLVPGGEERQDSVSNGIDFIKSVSINHEKDIVLIHDGVRPLININLIENCIKGAFEFGACVPAIRSVDTLKIINKDIVTKTLDRNIIYQIQTPQSFLLKIISDAIEYSKKKNFSGTDDASLVEFFGHKVRMINGLKHNIKITTKEDWQFAESYISL